MSELVRMCGVVCGYGSKEVIHEVDLSLREHEILALIGHNASGKSTLLKALVGIVPLWSGHVEFGGRRIIPSPITMVKLGAVYVPQGNIVFSDLTVLENIHLRASASENGVTTEALVDEVLKLFPPLRGLSRRWAGSLSGGEKQMLALASALVLGPRLLVLDEPTLGLAPGAAGTVFERLQQMNKATGVTLLIVEQKVREVLRIAHRVCVLRSGGITFDGAADELRDDERLGQVLL